MEFKVLEKTSKTNKQYYGLFLVKGDVEVLVCFLTENQFKVMKG